MSTFHRFFKTVLKSICKYAEYECQNLEHRGTGLLCSESTMVESKHIERIKKLLSASGFNREKTFISHLTELKTKRKRLDILIQNVTKSISAMKGEISMTDKEKFEGFKQSLIASYFTL